MNEPQNDQKGGPFESAGRSLGIALALALLGYAVYVGLNGLLRSLF